jgi:hypothetical protein
MNPLTEQDFLASLESALRQRRVAFSQAAVIAFVESAWELVLDHPCPEFWADRFVETGDVMAPA